jgi:hypothetical protein
MIPSPPTNGNQPATDKQWSEWCDKYYPFEQKWEVWLRTRKEKPIAGSEEELDDLRGIDRFGSYGPMVAYFARQWFHGRDHRADIEREQNARKELEQRKEKQRLIGLARAAISGTLGSSKSSQATAKATAQTFLEARDPGAQSFEVLQDWYTMHRYGLAISAGHNPPKPVLNRDRAAQARQRAELRDIDDAIGAQAAGRPSVEQGRLF